MQLVLVLERVVIILAIILDGDRFAQVTEFDYDLRIVIVNFNRASLGQEGGTIQDVTGSLSDAASSISPGESISWDVFDRLLPAHPGTASKVHMFGYRAVMNWKFDLSVWAEYRTAASPGPLKTPVLRWRVRWSVVDPASGAVGLTIEEIKD
jgi:hypothetical protein